VISFFATTRRENSIAKCALSGRLRTMVTGHADGVASRLRGNVRSALCGAVGRCAKQLSVLIEQYPVAGDQKDAEESPAPGSTRTLANMSFLSPEVTFRIIGLSDR
jgi:hypothetical protein